MPTHTNQKELNNSHWHPDNLIPRFDKYRSNDRVCVLLGAYNGEPYGILSVNIPEVPLNKDEFIVKNYSENTGLDNIDLYGGLFKDTGSVVRVGFNICPIWEITKEENT